MTGSVFKKVINKQREINSKIEIPMPKATEFQNPKEEDIGRTLSAEVFIEMARNLKRGFKISISERDAKRIAEKFGIELKQVGSLFNYTVVPQAEWDEKQQLIDKIIRGNAHTHPNQNIMNRDSIAWAPSRREK